MVYEVGKWVDKWVDSWIVDGGRSFEVRVLGVIVRCWLKPRARGAGRERNDCEGRDVRFPVRSPDLSWNMAQPLSTVKPTHLIAQAGGF
jgi:hypothetical protein